MGTERMKSLKGELILVMSALLGQNVNDDDGQS